MPTIFKQYLKVFILFLIENIEKWEFRNSDIDESDITKKIQNTIELENYLVSTDSGWQPASHIHQTQPYTVWKIETSLGKFLYCADNHIVFDEKYNQIFVKDLQIGSNIITEDGIEHITLIQKYSQKVSMFDLTVDSDDHRYWTNGILSHNTITSSIFLLWYLMFQYEKNAILMANKGATTKEIMDKVKNIMEDLPFFLKPGIIKKDIGSMLFDNKCRIITQNTTKTSGIGFTIHLLFLDEFAHIQESIKRPFYENIYPTLSSSKISRVIITSTPNGFDLFHDLYQAALDGLNEYVPLKVDWWDVPGRDEAWKEQEIANLGSEEAFNQQYGCQFLSSSSLLLNSEQILRLESNKKTFVFREFDALDDIFVDYSSLKWDPDEDVDDFYNSKDFFVFSIDLSEGVGRDYSVINIFKVISINDTDIKRMQNAGGLSKFFGLKQIGVFRSNLMNIEDFSKILYELCVNVFNSENLRVVLEYNMYGSELIRNLLTLYPNRNDFDEEVFVKFKHRVTSISKEIGLKYTRENKILYAEALKECISTGRMILQDDKTVEESKMFSRNKNGTYSAQSGHDDLFMTCITAAAIFDTIDFEEIIEEYFDYLDANTQQLIDDIYEDDVDTEDFYNIF